MILMNFCIRNLISTSFISISLKMWPRYQIFLKDLRIHKWKDLLEFALILKIFSKSYAYRVNWFSFCYAKFYGPLLQRYSLYCYWINWFLLRNSFNEVWNRIEFRILISTIFRYHWLYLRIQPINRRKPRSWAWT